MNLIVSPKVKIEKRKGVGCTPSLAALWG